MIKPPLILTLAIEKKTSDFFNVLRQKHFPPSRNFIGAHLTLFHSLPNEEEIVEAVRDTCNRQKSFMLSVLKPVSIGKGVAFKIESNELLLLHKALQNKWLEFLSPQDKQKLWPHVTVQNKGRVQEAQELLVELKISFAPFLALATGMQLWEYLDGPWKLVEDFYFKDVENL